MPRRQQVRPAVVRPTPALRRALFVAFLALGVLLAGSLVSAQRANDQLEQALEREAVAAEERTLLLLRVDALLSTIEAERRVAAQERDDLERLLIRLLAASDDPEVADAFSDLRERRQRERERGDQKSAVPSTLPTTGGESSSQQRRQQRREQQGGGGGGGNQEPRPEPRPTPQPSPRPTSPPPPPPAVCVYAPPPVDRRICTPV